MNEQALSQVLADHGLLDGPPIDWSSIAMTPAEIRAVRDRLGMTQDWNQLREPPESPRENTMSSHYSARRNHPDPTGHDAQMRAEQWDEQNPQPKDQDLEGLYLFEVQKWSAMTDDQIRAELERDDALMGWERTAGETAAEIAKIRRVAEAMRRKGRL